MRFLKPTLYIIQLVLIALATCYLLQNKKTGTGKDTGIRYELVANWPALPDSVILGNPTGIGIDSNQHIFVFHRAGRKWPLLSSMPTSFIKEKTILEIDKETGKLINSWGNDLFVMPHGLTVDKENNIWVTDVGLHQLFKFSHEGKLLMKLGEANVSGADSAHFNKPTDIAVATDGSFYVADGYGNSRIIKFSATGQYLFEWGSKGNKKGEFNIPHSIAVSHNGNVYVADRENKRVQVFTENGVFIKEFADNDFANITAVTFNKNNFKLFTSDDLSFLKIKHRGSDILLIDTNGTVQTRFGRSGSYTGPVCWYHDIITDDDENIYAGDIKGNTIQKFRKIRVH